MAREFTISEEELGSIEIHTSSLFGLVIGLCATLPTNNTNIIAI